MRLVKPRELKKVFAADGPRDFLQHLNGCWSVTIPIFNRLRHTPQIHEKAGARKGVVA